jgi:hypothetical protein
MKQPEALRLADELDIGDFDVLTNYAAAAELRRLSEALAAQPAVPDAFGTREGEHPQYVQGWNDCRAETLKMRKP